MQNGVAIGKIPYDAPRLLGGLRESASPVDSDAVTAEVVGF
jgi:hypothetical protein